MKRKINTILTFIPRLIGIIILYGITAIPPFVENAKYYFYKKD